MKSCFGVRSDLWHRQSCQSTSVFRVQRIVAVQLRALLVLPLIAEKTRAELISSVGDAVSLRHVYRIYVWHRSRRGSVKAQTYGARSSF